MTQNSDDNDVDIDPVVLATDQRVRREALRQLDSVDIEDDDARMEPLPTLVAFHPHEAERADESERSQVVPDHGENIGGKTEK